LKLPALDREDANRICKKWKENSSEIYAEIIKILHKE